MNKYRIITSDVSNHPAQKAFRKKSYRKDGEYIEEDLDTTQDFKKISDLYSKL